MRGSLFVWMLVALLLSACGGGSSAPEEVSVAGLWRGTLSVEGGDQEVAAIISPRGAFRLAAPAGAVQYEGAVAVDDFRQTGEGSFVGVPDGPQASGAVSFDIVPGQSLAGELTIDGAAAAPFALDYVDPGVSPPVVDEMAGRWATSVGDTWTTLTLDGNGLIVGKNSEGCVLDGRLRSLDPDHALFTVSLELSACSDPDSFSGMAALDPVEGLVLLATSDSVSLTLELEEGVNLPPVATAVTERTGKIDVAVTLDGSASVDPDGVVAGYAWTLLEAPAGSVAALVDADSATATFTPDLSGPYLFTLEVSDGLVWSEPLEVRLAVEEARFTDLGDGTVRDNTTGLIWLKEADCLGYASWEQALLIAAALGEGQCGLTDGTAAGDWRLPTIGEWEALVDTNYSLPALSNTAGSDQWSEGDAFIGVLFQSFNNYWSATEEGTLAWYADLKDGGTASGSKSSNRDIWAVRLPLAP